MKYKYTIMSRNDEYPDNPPCIWEGVVEADTPGEAAIKAFEEEYGEYEPRIADPKREDILAFNEPGDEDEIGCTYFACEDGAHHYSLSLEQVENNVTERTVSLKIEVHTEIKTWTTSNEDAEKEAATKAIELLNTSGLDLTPEVVYSRVKEGD